MKLHHLVIRVHRILGTALSILFLMWFLTGMVMMYHTYPSLSQQQRMEHAAPIVCQEIHQPAAPSPSSISIERIADRDIAIVKTNGEEHLWDIHSGNEISRFTDDELMQVARRWTTAEPTLIDTLNKIDVWLIGCMPFNEFPVYHYALNDGHGAELYLSSRTGHALQLTDSRSRFWAWVGAIPHWIYIKQLRATGRQPWTDVVLWLSGLGIVMTLTGLFIGVRATLIARRGKKSASRKLLTPYAKPLFRWHHLFGLSFGLFVLTWVFSGYMSLADAPRLIWPVHQERCARDLFADTLDLDLFRLNPARVLASGDIRRLDWMQTGGMPFYHVWTHDDDYLVDAADSIVRQVTLSANQCHRMVASVHHDETRIIGMLMTDYDNYYVSQKHPLPLPVWNFTVIDDDQSTYYINPRNADCRYYNDNRRAGKWMYTGLHALNTRNFSTHPLLRRAALWLLLLGGTVVSLTGVILTVRRIKRLKK